jgi:hypothetical protein
MTPPGPGRSAGRVAVPKQPAITPEEAIETLRQRRKWLTVRAESKAQIGWENIYDTRERDALTWALNVLAPEDLR